MDYHDDRQPSHSGSLQYILASLSEWRDLGPSPSIWLRRRRGDRIQGNMEILIEKEPANLQTA
jgi:hypothetical protein